MNAKHILTAISIVFGATGAMAYEPTQFDDVPSTLTREQVKAELAEARQDMRVVVGGEATEFILDHPSVAVARSRDEVRAEAIAAAREHRFNDLYVGGGEA